MNSTARTSRPRTSRSLRRLLTACFVTLLAIMGVALLVRLPSASPATTPTSLAPQTGPMPPARAFASWRSRNWPALTGRVELVHTWTIHYTAYNGARAVALVVLPSWYGSRTHPAIPLVISPHGRGVKPSGNMRLWGNMPALGRFAVVTPAGPNLYTWGVSGQIDDLARMPRIVQRALPWLQIAPHRIYAVGGSMGGQETLLLAADHPHLLAGAVSFDADTNMSARYAAFPELRYGLSLQERLRRVTGGIPATRPDAYQDRSPMDDAADIAASGVPLQIWWSTRDRIVVNQASESGLLYRTIERDHPRAPVVQYVGQWRHTTEMWPDRRMPIALVRLGLLQLGAAEVRA